MSDETKEQPAEHATEDVSPRVVTRSIWYKRVEYPNVKGQLFSLENAVRDGLAIAKHWRDRVMVVRDQPREVIVMNQAHEINAGVVGRLSLYEKDAAIEIGELDEANPTIQTEFLLPNGPNRQVCSGTLHFLVHGNNVILIPSRAVQWKALYEFMNHWLGPQKLGVLPDGVSVGLMDVVPSRARAELSKVRRVEIRTALTADVVDWENEEPGIQMGFVGVLANSVSEMVKQGGGEPLSVKKAVTRRPLHAKLILERRGRRRADDEELLDQIALAVRYQEGVPFVIRYGRRGKLTNADVTVSDQIVLPAKYGHPQFVATARKMLEWYKEKLDAGEIQPERDFIK